MAKMMTYGEANAVLESSLSPSNRCITKSVALANGAETDPLANYATSRLVPASAVQKGSTPPGPEPPGPEPPTPTYEIERYFVDDLGNKINDYEITLNVGKGSRFAFFRVKTVVNGNPPPSKLLDKHEPYLYNFISSSSAVLEHHAADSNPTNRGVIVTNSRMEYGFIPEGPLKNDGVTMHCIKLYEETSSKNTGWDYSDIEVYQNTQGINDRWSEYGLKYNVVRSTDDSFSINKGYKSIAGGTTWDINVTCSHDWVVSYIDLYPGTNYAHETWNKVETMSTATKIDNNTVRVRAFNSESDYFNLYKITDTTTNEVIYFGVTITEGSSEPTQTWTVTYLGHDGDTFATRTVNDGEAAPNIEIGYTTEDNYVLQNWIDLPSSVTSNCTVYGNWVYTPPTQQITVNVKVANAIDDVIYVQNVYITSGDSGDKQISFNGIALNHTEEYTEQGTAYEGTITKVVVNYARSGGQYSKTIPYVDWWTNNSDTRKLEEGNTLTIRMNY